MKCVPIIVLIFAASCLATDTESPRSMAALQARRGYDKSIAEAKATYDQAIKRARTNYLVEMAGALDAALTAKDLAEANRIDAAMKAEPPVAATTDEPRIVQQLDGSTWKMRGSPFNAQMTFRAIDMSVDVKETKNPGIGTWVVYPAAGIKKHNGKEGDVWIRVHRPGLQSEIYKFSNDMRVMQWLDEKTYIWDRAK